MYFLHAAGTPVIHVDMQDGKLFEHSLREKATGTQIIPSMTKHICPNSKSY